MASLAFPTLAKKATLSDGTTYGYIHVPPAAPSKPTFLLLHGAPSSSYIWHHQIELLPKAGFGVIAPDLLGYGDTDRPEALEAYQFSRMVPQVYELVTKAVGVEKVIGVGHDFGSPLLSHLYVHHKELFSGLIFVAAGFTIVDTRLNLDTLIAVSKQMLGYSTSGYMQVFLSSEGSSLVEKNAGAFDSLMFAKDPEAWKEHLCAEGALQKFLEAGKELPVADWISPEELATHQRILKGGYDGVFNWYKAIAFLDPAKEDQDLSSEDQKITVPTLFIATTKDYAIIPAVQVHMTREAAQDNLKIETLDTGHWAMLEAKETVEKMFEEFASGLSM